MKYYTEYENHSPEILGKRKKYDNTIYTFDIETTSYLILGDNQIDAKDYQKLSEDERAACSKCSCMYIWMFSINEDVYYGRTWQEFKEFIKKLDSNVPEHKYVFVHNLAFEFQYLKTQFRFSEVAARKAHKVMSAILEDYNIEFRCSLIMSNAALKLLPKLFHLDVEKMVGDLNYNLSRTSVTPLTDKEMGYCKNDCLVVYKYIKYELETYETVKNIPITSTGHVRRELKNLVMQDYKYKRIVSKAVNTNPHVYNLLMQCFMGGYTHSNWIYTDELLKDIDSWDFTSSYPYILVTHKFPSTEFKKCNIKSVEKMSKRLAYIVVVKFTDLKCKYYNNFISKSKCRNIRGAKYDNGRIMEAEELEITLTDVDFRFILESYKCKYEILECWFSVYNYLPKQFINFVLDKYVVKTQYKGVEGMEVAYQKEKNKFNALYGMSVTNTIRDEVEYSNESDWSERPLTNDEIEAKLLSEKKTGFLSFAYGVWVTAHARYNLLSNVIKLDDHVVYCDTDSIKLLPGYDKKVIDDYNKNVLNKIKFVSNLLNIDENKYSPKDKKGKARPLGVFDDDGHYEEFITQGAKKYAVKQDGEIKITVAGVPKSGAKALKDLNDFRDSLVFEFEDTNKNLLFYCENQQPFKLTDYLGTSYEVNDKSGCCLVPTTYVLGKALEYTHLISNDSSSRAVYNEEVEND